MIVKMKKVSLVVLDSSRTDSLDKLRDLGVIHIEREYKSNNIVNSLIEKKTQFEKSILVLPETKKAGAARSGSSLEDVEKISESVNKIIENIKKLEDEIEKNRKDLLILGPWGDFTPADIAELEKKGFFIKFYELSKEKFEKIPDSIKFIPVNEIKNNKYLIAVSLENIDACTIPDAECTVLPEAGISELKSSIKEKEEEIVNIKSELEKLGNKRDVLVSGLKELEEKLQFEAVNADMGTEDVFAYISGFVPVDLVDNLKAAAAANKWALLIQNPEEDETPPTLIRNPKWIKIIQPLFKFLDTTPGYREFDISMLFLMFFTVFVAMIVGDAGYGIIFLGLTIFTKITVKNAPKELFTLLGVLSFATIAWGVVTGTWFGSVTLSEVPLLSALIIPEIASFGPEDTSGMIKQISFLIGLTHLTIGLLINFARKMPSLAAVAEIGWLMILYAMYFAARFFVLGVDLNPVALYLFGIGFSLIILFSEQNGNIIKGIFMGLAWSPMKFLDSVSMFADLVSYIRLFAVGLATVAVAQSFNTMASGFEGISGMIISAVILFVAHTFNMGMALLSIIVHGVRLNMLEFGGKLGMEWSGYNFSPFRKMDS